MSGQLVDGYRWCPVKGDVATWEEGQERGCSWCPCDVDHQPHPRLRLEAAVPLVWQDDEGETYYAQGHVDRDLFLTAVGEDLSKDLGRQGAGVRHTWWRPTDGRQWGDDAEAMERCEASDDRARPFTEVELT